MPGWNLPPGAATDPNAPWNLPDPDWGCTECYACWFEQPAADGEECPDCGEGEVLRI